MITMSDITICIPTCFGGNSLIKAIRSLRSAGGKHIPVLVLADSIPLSAHVKKQLTLLGVTFFENKTPSSQLAKLKQMIPLVKTPYLVFTQDDISVSKNAFAEIVTLLQKQPTITMFSVQNHPTPPTSFVDAGLTAGTHITQRIEITWNNGQNFLRGCGRLQGFKTSQIRKFRIPEKVVNLDAYFYFENKRLGGVFERSEEAIVFYTLPKSLYEQTRKSSRYLYCYEEMCQYFGDLKKEFSIPMSLKLSATLIIFITHPLVSLAYLPILVMTRLIREKRTETQNVLWKVDVSTK